jgi:hypothetical protein
MGVAFADPGDASTAGPDSASTTSKAEDNKQVSHARDSSKPDRPTSTVGNGRQDVDVARSEEARKQTGLPPATMKFSGSITIPIPQIPKRDELPANGLPNPALFYTTVVIRVPTLADVVAALQPQPTPVPVPAVRTDDTAPAAIDSGGGGGGGADPLSVHTAAEPQVLHAPMAIAPVVVPRPAALEVAATAGPRQLVPVEGASAGADAPVLHGSLPPSVESATKLLTPTNGRTTRAGYTRYARTPTSVELAVVALPGLAGLVFFTCGGGLIGYRQANSVRFLRARGDARFLR